MSGGDALLQDAFACGCQFCRRHAVVGGRPCCEPFLKDVTCSGARQRQRR